MAKGPERPAFKAPLEQKLGLSPKEAYGLTKSILFTMMLFSAHLNMQWGDGAVGSSSD